MARDGRSVEGYLIHLSEWIEKVELVEREIAANPENAQGINELALCRALEVVGEICGRLISEHPRWCEGKRGDGLDDAYRLRNKIIHGYDTLELRLLLVIAREYIPDLKKAAIVWLADARG